MQLFYLIFTQPGNVILVQPCSAMEKHVSNPVGFDMHLTSLSQCHQLLSTGYSNVPTPIFPFLHLNPVKSAPLQSPAWLTAFLPFIARCVCVQTGGVPEKTEIRHNGETMQSRHQKAIQEHSHTTSVTYRIFMDIFTPLSKWCITTSLASLSFDVIWVCTRSFSPRAASKEERCDIFKIAKEVAIHPGKQSPPPSQPYPSSCSGKTKEGFLCTFSRAGEEKKRIWSAVHLCCYPHRQCNGIAIPRRGG